VVAIQWNGTTELVSVMEWFHNCITMVLGWDEGGLKNLAMVGSGDFMVAGNGYNSCCREWHFGGTYHLDGQIKKS
jgi:hypothetical protein